MVKVAHLRAGAVRSERPNGLSKRVRFSRETLLEVGELVGVYGG